MHYLLKTEPTAYSFADLLRDKETDWTGVTNPQAVKNLAGMKKGDKLVIYHTGDEKTAVGLAHVKSVDLSNPKVPLVWITAGAAIKRPKTLAEIKQQSLFETSALVRQSRLSVVPLNEAQYDWIAHN
jgi:predicted RNA-binding protein with PUA-like domain